MQDPAFLAGIDFSRRGEHPGAIAAFEAAIARHPGEAEGPFQLGLAYQRRAEAILPPALREKGHRNGRHRPGRIRAGVGSAGRVQSAGADGLDRAVPGSLPAVRPPVGKGHSIQTRMTRVFTTPWPCPCATLGQTEAAAEAARSACRAVAGRDSLPGARPGL